MKIWAMAAALVLAGTAAWADPLEGLWRTVADDNGNSGLIEIKPCGDRFCGTLIKAFDATGAAIDSDNIGKKIIWDMVAEGDGFYDGGQVWSPDRDKTYASKLQLSGNKLTVRGCVFGICRDGGVWSRAN